MEAIAKETGPASYREAFEERRGARRAEPSSLTERRERAFERFLERGFPGPRDEAWRFTNIRRITSTAWAPASGRPAVEFQLEPGFAAFKTRIPEVFELVYVNGRLSPELSRGEVPAGLRVRELTSALADGGGSPLDPWLARIASESPFTDLNASFFEGGVAIEIAPGAVLDQPVHLIFVSLEEEAFAFTSPRVLVVAGAQSHSHVVETYLGGDGVYWTNAVTEIVARDGAIVEHTKRQEESSSGFHTQTIAVLQERASRFTSHNLALGAALARTDLAVRFDGEGGECSLNGLFVGSGTQHLDNHTVVDHARPHCASRQLYKGILDGRARGVFHGTVLVRHGAQKTDAIQTNKNLLLSREALVDSTPALEILADDVKCKHGSTTGQLDAAALFYLRSRGIGEAEARSLLVGAFASDVVGRIPSAQIRAAVEADLGLRLRSALEAS